MSSASAIQLPLLLFFKDYIPYCPFKELWWSYIQPIATFQHKEFYSQIALMYFMWHENKVTSLNSIYRMHYNGNRVFSVRWAQNFIYDVESCKSSRVILILASLLPYGYQLVFLHPHEIDTMTIIATTVRHCNALRTRTDVVRTPEPQETLPKSPPNQLPVSSSSSSSSKNNNINISINVCVY